MSVRRRRSNNDSRRYYDWLDRAGEDIISAYLLMQDDFTYNPAAFHCQQAIEKSYKAYILLKSNRLVDGHNLTWLTQQAARYNKSYNKWLKATGPLNRAYIETRYPADIPVKIDYSIIEEFYQTAKSIYLQICEEIDGLALTEKQQKPCETLPKDTMA